MAALLWSACSQELVLLPALPENPDAKIEVLFVGTREEGPETHYVVDLADVDDPIRFDLPMATRRFEAFFLLNTVEELAAMPGRDTLGDGAVLPSSQYRSFSASYEPGSTVAWDTEPQPLWSEFLRFPGVGDRGCLLRGGCLIGGICSLSCDVDVTPDAPRPPNPPRFTCAVGWRPQTITYGTGPSESVTVCEPWPDGTPACGESEIRVPGVGCTALAAPCPAAGDFPAARPGRTVYVREGATGGDGTRERPFANLQAALQVDPAPARVMFAAGTYAVTPQTLSADIEWVGACPRDVRLQGDLTISTATVTLQSITWAGTLAIDRGTASLLGVRIESADDRAVDVVDGDLRADSLRIDNTAGVGISLRRSIFEGQRVDLSVGNARAISALENSAVTLQDWVVDSAPTGSFIDASTFDGSRGVIMGARLNAVNGAVVNLDEGVIRSDLAVRILNAELNARQLWVDQTSSAFASVTSQLRLTDSVVTSFENEDQVVFTGGDGGSIILNRVVVAGEGRAAANVRLLQTDFTDVVWTGMASGLALTEVEPCRFTRVMMSNLGNLGVFLRKLSCRFEDVLITDIGTDTCMEPVTGLDLSQADVSSNRVEVTGVQGRLVKVELGNWIAQDTRLTDATLPADCSAEAGIGVDIDTGHPRLHRFRIEGPYNSAFLVRSSHGPRPTLTASVGVVAGSRYALELAIPDFDVAPLMDRVAFRDNEFIILDPDQN